MRRPSVLRKNRLRAWVCAGAFGATGLVAHDGLMADDAAEPGKLPSLTRVVAPAWSPMDEHAKRVVDYTLRAKLDPTAHTVHGEGTIAWTNVSSAPVKELWVHLYLNGFKNQSSVFMRSPIGGFRGTTVPQEWGTIDVRRFTWRTGDGPDDKVELWNDVELRRGSDEDETDARVPLPRQVQPGETLRIEMVWDDKLPSVVERTGFDGSFHMVGQWFPKIAKIEPDGTFAHFPFHHLGEFYADFGRYDVTLDVPEAFVVGATGPLVTAEQSAEPGRRIERHVQDDIHDFAWTAWDRFQTRRETIDGVDVAILFPPGHDGNAERELATMRFALPHYGERYGRYPYPGLTIVHPPSSAQEAGGMEYPTLITTGAASFTPEGIYSPELVTIHEFGHQYFYGLVATHETSWPFLDEGLNSYAETEAMEAWKGAGSAMDRFGLRIGTGMFHADRARHFGHDERVAMAAHMFQTGAAYGGLVYNRSAAILETLRRVYGDAPMRRAMGEYTRLFRFHHPTPDALIAVFDRNMGPAAADVIRGAFFQKGWVDFAVTQIASHAVHPPAGIFDVAGKRETVKGGGAGAGSGKYQGWVLVHRRGTLTFPVEIELVAEDGTRTRVPWDGVTDSVRVPYTGSSPLRSAVVDPDQRVLLDQQPENDFATAPGRSQAGAPRVLERATYWAQLLGGIAP